MKLQYTNHSPDTLSLYLVSCMAECLSKRQNFVIVNSYLKMAIPDIIFHQRTKRISQQAGFSGEWQSWRIMQDHPEYIDVMKLILPQPLLPGDSIAISASFHLRIPYNFNGNGYGSASC